MEGRSSRCTHCLSQLRGEWFGQVERLVIQSVISLPFQYTQQRMEVPVRSVNCAHLQCFDLRSFLAKNERRPNWICPLCGSSALHSELRIDA